MNSQRPIITLRNAVTRSKNCSSNNERTQQAAVVKPTRTKIIKMEYYAGRALKNEVIYMMDHYLKPFNEDINITLYSKESCPLEWRFPKRNAEVPDRLRYR